ncbi:MAG TPA: flavodoxin domain-containing protein [Candidatus Acidoferrales bacterium]|nr:flavodoxin domain-containing protein [Candidatus Acidoferrales bacterium]
MSSSAWNPFGPAHFDPRKSELRPSGLASKRIAVFFATREGHTQRVAERLTSDLLALGFDVDLLPAGQRPPFALANYCAAVLAASVHAGNHEKEMVEFVKDHRLELEGMPTAFLSVTLSEAGVEMPEKSAAERASFANDVNTMLDKFYAETHWHPTVAKPVAGALLYTHYNFLVRLIMKRIARKAGASTDTSRDHDYTDWVGLDKFADELAATIRSAHLERSGAATSAESTGAQTQERHD